MDVSFGRKPLRRRRELHVIGPACHDAVPWLHAALETHEVPVARRDLDEAPREPFAANLHEHVRTSGFHQHGGFWRSSQSLATTGVENRRAGLADEELTI